MASPDTKAADTKERDYFTDPSVLRDPYEYFGEMYAKAPVHQLTSRDILVVTGFDESLEVLKNSHDFSSLISVPGAAYELPFKPEGDDIDAQLQAIRPQVHGGDLLVTYDDRKHANSRALLNRLFVPSRLKANEEYMTGLAERLAVEAAAKGGCEMMGEIATPFATLVIADLLGVPDEDRDDFMKVLEISPPAGNMEADQNAATSTSPLEYMATFFVRYLQDRRDNPRDDILTELATATFPDGTTPDLMELVRLSTFLFGAGQDTSAKLLGNAMRFLVEQPGLQDQLRADPSKIPAFLEEVLRLEGSTKMTSRIARKDTSVAGMDMPAGTRVMIALSAANRDPRRWEDPQGFQLDRPRIKEHVGFGRGAHVCIGAPLARVEVRVILEKFLEHTSKIDFLAEKHGPPGARKLDYEPSFIIRGLAELHLTLEPAKDFKGPAEKSAIVAPSAPAAGYSTGASTIGTLLGNPATLAVIDRHFPGVSTDPRIGMGKAMTFRAVQAFAPDMFTLAALDAADVDLAKIPLG